MRKIIHGVRQKLCALFRKPPPLVYCVCNHCGKEYPKDFVLTTDFTPAEVALKDVGGTTRTVGYRMVFYLKICFFCAKGPPLQLASLIFEQSTIRFFWKDPHGFEYEFAEIPPNGTYKN